MRLEYFQLIDRIAALDIAGRTITVDAHVPEQSTIFEGHFPGNPLMPGVLLIESMAQTSGWLLIALHDFTRMPFLAAVKEAKLRRFIQPNEQLSITARVAHEGSGFAMTEAEIHVDGKLTCNATLTFRHIAFPNSEMRTHMDAMAEKLGFPKQALPHD